MPTSTRMPARRFARPAAVAGSVLFATSLASMIGLAAPASAAPTDAPLSVPQPISTPAPDHAAVTFAEQVARAATPSAADIRLERVVNALAIAQQQIGDPYVYGATGPNAFDCSGLVLYSLTRAGFTNIPRTAAEQAAAVRHIARSEMHPGDLVFFGSGGGVYHVGFFLRWDKGTAVILHAPHPGASVEIERVWTDGWFAGTLR